jgi:hypothetical protein
MKCISALTVAITLAPLIFGFSAVQAGPPAPIAIHSVSVELPVSRTEFPPGPGSDLAGKCLICHSASMVLKQPALSRAQWTAEINKMRHTYGAPIDDDEVDKLSLYLAKINADQQTH